MKLERWDNRSEEDRREDGSEGQVGRKVARQVGGQMRVSK